MKNLKSRTIACAAVLVVSAFAATSSFAPSAASGAAYCAAATPPAGIAGFQSVPADLCATLKSAGIRPATVDKVMATQPKSVKKTLSASERLARRSEMYLEDSQAQTDVTGDMVSQVEKQRSDVFGALAKATAK